MTRAACAQLRRALDHLADGQDCDEDCGAEVSESHEGHEGHEGNEGDEEND